MVGDIPFGSIIRFRQVPYCIPMPTAISRIYTKEGFVVAADSRSQNSETGENCDSTQKIFLVNKPGILLAYSLAGTVGITPTNSAEIIFDFYRESSRAIESDRVRNARPKTLHEYADLFSNEVYERLSREIEKQPDAYFQEEGYQARETGPDGGFKIVQIWFDGYYIGVASSARVEFFHVEQRIDREIRSPIPMPDGPECYGSKKVLDLIKTASFSDYKLPHQDWEVLTLSAAIGISRDLILAQMSDGSRRIDEDAWGAIGGRIHAATVTRSAGAAWVPGFEPKGSR